MNYKAFIEDNFRIIDKNQTEVPFILNDIQNRYLLTDSTKRDVILKARQQGFSSLILSIFTVDFILLENTRSVITADSSDNAAELLDRVKYYIKTYEDINNVKVPLKYNSKYELLNESNNSRYTIGTADNPEFGRSKTITNLHFSEAAFYPNLKRLMAGAGTAVVPNGRFILETTANGFNEFKTLWDELHQEGSFKPLFYKASDFYDPDFLEIERLRLKQLFPQEYPETAEEAFLTSGDLFFDPFALKYYLANSIQPVSTDPTYV